MARICKHTSPKQKKNQASLIAIAYNRNRMNVTKSILLGRPKQKRERKLKGILKNYLRILVQNLHSFIPCLSNKNIVRSLLFANIFNNCYSYTIKGLTQTYY